MSRNRRGFSLVEMMLTVALIGITGLIAAPEMLDTVPKYRVEGATKGLASQMQAVRMRAVAKNLTHHVLFDAAAQTITVQEEDSSGNRTTVQTTRLATEFPKVSLGYHAVTNPDGSGTISQAASFGASSSAEAVFLPNGTMVESGAFYLLPTADVSGSRNDRLRGVQVGLAGQTTLYRYKAGATPPWEAY